VSDASHFLAFAGGVCKFADASAMIAGAFDSSISGTYEPELGSIRVWRPVMKHGCSDNAAVSQVAIVLLDIVSCCSWILWLVSRIPDLILSTTGLRREVCPIVHAPHSGTRSR
jgi:hypothetical protein